jgi:hypothetical protein
MRERFASSILKQVELVNAMTRETLAFARGDRSLWIRKVYLKQFFEELCRSAHARARRARRRRAPGARGSRHRALRSAQDPARDPQPRAQRGRGHRGPRRTHLRAAGRAARHLHGSRLTPAGRRDRHRVRGRRAGHPRGGARAPLRVLRDARQGRRHGPRPRRSCARSSTITAARSRSRASRARPSSASRCPSRSRASRSDRRRRAARDQSSRRATRTNEGAASVLPLYPSPLASTPTSTT